MNTPLILIRHAPTAWNAEGRMQGRSDIELNEQGREQAGLWRLPVIPDISLCDAFWVSSPLKRAQETASILGHEPSTDSRLVEMDWGAWEGRTLADLRNLLGDEMQALEERGLDFQPPGGESPRMVQQRVKPWLADMAAPKQPVIAVTHKGVTRAIMAMAAGWNMLGKPPFKLMPSSCHLFNLEPDGTPHIVTMNIPLHGHQT